MRILIKAEQDTRPTLYPLLYTLMKHGSIVVFTTNKLLTRLIDGELEGGFRNIRIIYDVNDSYEDVAEEYRVAPGDYDFEILDGTTSTDFDLMLIPISANVSKNFIYDIEGVLDLPNVKTIHFGAKAVQKKTSPDPKTKGQKVEHANTAYNPDSKWSQQTSDEAIKEKLAGAKATWSPFPSFQDIETLESTYRFYPVERSLAMQFYEILGQYLNQEQRYFIKEVTSKDESSGHITTELR